MQLASGFARYVQYRDGGEDKTRAADVASFTRYAAYRDQAAPEGRLFDGKGTIGDAERRALVRYIRASTRDSAGNAVGGRAFYRMVISPEDARGVDLRELTRRTMAQLEQDCGRLPPWIAAEHRNTDHPHVHVILAARHIKVPGRTRALMITRPRLERMKDTMTAELLRQQVQVLVPNRAIGLDVVATRAREKRAPNVVESLLAMARGRTSLSRALSRPRGGGAVPSLFGAIGRTLGEFHRLDAEELRRQERERARGRTRE